MKPQPGSTVDTVRDFWQAHINNEYYTDAERASDSYFDEIEQRRYRTHYHLPELFASLDGAGRSLLEVGCGIGVDSIQLAQRGFTVTAVDLTENALTAGSASTSAWATPRDSTFPTRASTWSTRSASCTTPRTSAGPWPRCTGSCVPAGRPT